MDEDTVRLVIDSVMHVIIEHRTMNVDDINYYDQFLECVDCEPSPGFIYDAIILAINKKTITFRLEVEAKKAGKTVKKQVVVQIYNDRLDGIMYLLS